MKSLLALVVVFALAVPVGAEITLPCAVGPTGAQGPAGDPGPTGDTGPTGAGSASYTTVLNSFEAPGDLPPGSPGSCDDEFNNGTTIDGAWSWVNQGGATIAQTSGYQLLEAPANGTDDWRLRCRTAPSVPFTLTARISCGFANIGASGRCALVVRNSGTNHFHELGPAATGSLDLSGYDWNSVTSAASSRVSASNFNIFQYLRIVVTSTTAYSGWGSTDGVTWTRLFNVTGDGFLGTPDQVCFGADSSNNAAVDTLLYWMRCS